MGNLLEVSSSNYLLSEVNPPLTLLQNCTFHKGSSLELLHLHKKLLKLNIIQGFYIQFSDIPRVFKNSRIEYQSSIIETYFGSSKFKKVNIMEVFACLIAYSECFLNEKVKLALDIFDLDGNQVITKDEMSIMCISFMRGIALMTQSSYESKNTSEHLADQAFYLADSDPDGMITYDE